MNRPVSPLLHDYKPSSGEPVKKSKAVHWFAFGLGLPLAAVAFMLTIRSAPPEIVIVDEFTGRLMPDRSWRDGMHQAVEAKEKVEINAPKDTYARVSFQRFFRMYGKLAGMTGTALEARDEFWQGATGKCL